MNKSPLAWFLSSKIASLLKISFIVGSHTAFFSAVNICNPLIGAFNSRLHTLLIFFALFTVRWFTMGICDFHFLAFFVPGLFAALYWNTKGPLIRLLVPLLCFFLFVLHPVGREAALYACYWLIPIGLYFKQHDNRWIHALCSTFVAHAVGSIIWIYAMPMSAAVWLSLIPIVFLERFTFAGGIALAHLLISKQVEEPILCKQQ